MALAGKTITIELLNCNNFDTAKISLTTQQLNIRLAPNGTGKSTIARALVLQATDGDLSELTPFKLASPLGSGAQKPQIQTSDSISTVKVFNEDYINQFVFQKEELLANSYNILIKSDLYLEMENAIQQLLTEIKERFNEHEELTQILSILGQMSNLFRLSRNGIARNSGGFKGLARGNNLMHVPPELQAYKPFIQSNRPIEWMDWQLQGTEFGQITTACPYCTNDTSKMQEQIALVGDTYDKSTIRNLKRIIDLLDEFESYLAPNTAAKLRGITQLKDSELGDAHLAYLLEVRRQIGTLENQLQRLRDLSAFSFNHTDKPTAESIKQLKIDLDLFPHLHSEKMTSEVKPVNDALEILIGQAGVLQGKATQQQLEIQKRIKDYQRKINNFLSDAGYSYRVAVEGTAPDAKLLLKHEHSDAPITEGGQHLSFGERNAFALVLFMYECLADPPDLIILDDPVSSFDENKKFAVLEKLFLSGRKQCLAGHTVLMLTHDLEPVIDTVHSLHSMFQGRSNSAFLHLHNGKIKEIGIERNDIKSFLEILKKASQADFKHDLLRIIYLRQYLELTEPDGDGYEVAANVIKGRCIPLDYRTKNDNTTRTASKLPKSARENGIKHIRQHIPLFEYDAFVGLIKDRNSLMQLYNETLSRYEKLQLFRILAGQVKNRTFRKFINETYHPENQLLFQLDPSKFDIIPEYIIALCDEILKEVSAA